MTDKIEAAREAATRIAYEAYTRDQIAEDGGYRWSVHRDGAEEGYLAGHASRDAELADLRAKLAAMREPLWMLREEHEAETAELRARLEAAKMVIGNYLPVCIGDCGCEGANTGCAILGDDPEATAVAEEIAIRMALPVPLPETEP